MQVYQPEFEEPWAQGLVSQHDPVTHIMEITMDQVLSYSHLRLVYIMLNYDFFFVCKVRKVCY